MDDADALRQQLRDEAAWRAFVEDELARESEKARVWRERAEERAERIQRLTAGRSLRNAIASRVAAQQVPTAGIPDQADAAAAAAAVLATAPAGGRPRHPEVRAAALVTSAAVRALTAELDGRDIADEGAAAWRDADVGVLEAAAWGAAPDLHDTVLTWLATPERPPVVWCGAVPGAVADALGPRDVVVGAETTASAVLELPPWAAAIPARQLPRPGFPGRWAEDGTRRLLVTRTSTALAMVPDDPHRALGFAAAGIPVLAGDGSAPHGLPGPAVRVDLAALDRGGDVPDELRRLAIRQRRWVEARAQPAHRVTALLEALQVPHVQHTPRLAVLLSSNKPTLVPAQIASLARQTRRPDDLHVALHGGASPSERRAVEAAAEAAGLPLHLTLPDASRPLGSVLNDLADAATTDVLAKIDDDDHYGPAHLSDAATALLRTGADLVGKKAHYVHLTGEDRTWLLAADAEDQWVEEGVMGATFVWRRGLMEQVRFSPRPRRVDSIYVRSAVAAGARLWALPANDFAYVRDPGGRTNIAGPSFVRARGQEVGPGLPLAVIDV